MSTTIEASVILGMRVTRSMFLEKIGERHVCERGHVRPEDVPFCDQCGAKVGTKDVERATEVAIRWADKQGAKCGPEGVWVELCEASEMPAATRGEAIAIFNVSPLQPAGGVGRFDALGCCLLHTVAYRPPAAATFNPALLHEKTRLIVEQATAMGLPEGPVHLHLALYVG